MENATSFDCKNLSGLKAESKDEKMETENIECIADKMEFKVVWQQDVNMQLVNQFMEQLDIYDENPFENQTPSNISALISSSFPSDEKNSKEIEVESDSEEFSPQFISSTPFHKDTSKSESLKFDFTAFEEFNKASPIYSPPKKTRNILTKRRLQYSFEFEDFGKTFKIMKI
jgi:hypothetical protein